MQYLFIFILKSKIEQQKMQYLFISILKLKMEQRKYSTVRVNASITPCDVRKQKHLQIDWLQHTTEKLKLQMCLIFYHFYKQLSNFHLYQMLLHFFDGIFSNCITIIQNDPTSNRPRDTCLCYCNISNIITLSIYIRTIFVMIS